MTLRTKRSLHNKKGKQLKISDFVAAVASSVATHCLRNSLRIHQNGAHDESYRSTYIGQSWSPPATATHFFCQVYVDLRICINQMYLVVRCSQVFPVTLLHHLYQKEVFWGKCVETVKSRQSKASVAATHLGHAHFVWTCSFPQIVSCFLGPLAICFGI